MLETLKVRRRELLALSALLGSFATIAVGCGSGIQDKSHSVKGVFRSVPVYKAGKRSISIEKDDYFVSEGYTTGHTTVVEIDQSCDGPILTSVIEATVTTYSLDLRFDPPQGIREETTTKVDYDLFLGCEDGKLTKADFKTASS